MSGGFLQKCVSVAKSGLLQRFAKDAVGKGYSNSSQALQGSCKQANGVANDAKNGLVDVAEETVDTLKDVMEVQVGVRWC